MVLQSVSFFLCFTCHLVNKEVSLSQYFCMLIFAMFIFARLCLHVYFCMLIFAGLLLHVYFCWFIFAGLFLHVYFCQFIFACLFLPVYCCRFIFAGLFFVSLVRVQLSMDNFCLLSSCP